MNKEILLVIAVFVVGCNGACLACGAGSWVGVPLSLMRFLEVEVEGSASEERDVYVLLLKVVIHYSLNIRQYVLSYST